MVTPEEIRLLAEEADAVRKGILISTASMLAIGVIQLEIYKNNSTGAVDKAHQLAQYLIDKVTSEKENQETEETPEPTN